MKKIIKYKYLIILIISYIITFINDIKIFEKSNPFTNYLYPYSGKNFYLKYTILKIIVLIILYLILKGVKKIINNKDKDFVIGFVFCFIINLITALLHFPGLFEYDVLHIFEYATKLEFVSWHNIYTSLFYMLSLSFIPCPFGIVLCQIILISIIVGIIYKCLIKISNRKILSFFMIVIFLLTITNRTYAIWPFRTTISAYLETLLVVYAILNYKKIDNKKEIFIFILLTAFLAVYRSENILYFILPLIIYKKLNIKKIFIYLLSFCAIFTIISIPQKIIHNNYYSKDYLIINTFYSLQYIYNSNSFVNVGAKDTEALEKIVPIEYLKKYSVHGYFENNYEKTGIATTIGKDSKIQSDYLKTAIKLYLKNYKLYIKSRVNWFTITAFNKAYFDNYQIKSERNEYFFEKELNSLTNRIEKKYNLELSPKVYQINLLNKNTFVNINVSVLIILLGIIIAIINKNFYILLFYALLGIKAFAVVIMAPQQATMYFYYLYLCSYFMLLIGVLKLKIINNKRKY